MFKKIFSIASIAFFSSAVFAEPFVFDEGNFIVLNDQVSEDSISKLTFDLLSNKNDVVKVYINSGGGSVVAMNEFINVLNATDKKVECYANFAASAAFTMLQACDTRIASPISSILMQHYGSYGLGQQPQNLQTSMIKMLDNLMYEFTENERERIGGYSHEDYVSLIRNDWWSSGKQALERNIVDTLKFATCTPELTKAKKIEKINYFGANIELTFSKCPLIATPLSIVFQEEDKKRLTEEDVENIKTEVINLYTNTEVIRKIL